MALTCGNSNSALTKRLLVEPKCYIKVPQIKFETDKNSIYQMMIAMLEVKTIKNARATEYA